MDRRSRYRSSASSHWHRRYRAEEFGNTVLDDIGYLLVIGLKRLFRLIWKSHTTKKNTGARDPAVLPNTVPQWPKGAVKAPFNISVTGAANQQREQLPYKRAQYLLSKGERAFWFPLYYAVKGRYRIFCKVRLFDLLTVPLGWRDERRWFNKVRGYHVDFVICDAKTTAPLLVVELDDRTHSSGARPERDAFKDSVLTAAGIPIYRVPARRAYDVAEIVQAIDNLIIRK